MLGCEASTGLGIPVFNEMRWRHFLGPAFTLNEPSYSRPLLADFFDKREHSELLAGEVLFPSGHGITP